MLLSGINENKSIQQKAIMGQKLNGNKRLGSLNKKDKLIESEISKIIKRGLIDLTNKLLSKHNILENRLDKLEVVVKSMKEDYKQHDEVVEDTKKTANAILLKESKKRNVS